MAKDEVDARELVRSLLASSGEHSSPGAYYSKDGDCAFFFNEDVPHRRVRIDHLLTIYRAEEDQRIIGVQVKAISKLPRHDMMQIHVGSQQGDGGKKVDMVRILLLTFQKTMTATQGDGERIGAYADAMRAAAEAPALELA